MVTFWPFQVWFPVKLLKRKVKILLRRDLLTIGMNFHPRAFSQQLSTALWHLSTVTNPCKSTNWIDLIQEINFCTTRSIPWPEKQPLMDIK